MGGLGGSSNKDENISGLYKSVGSGDKNNENTGGWVGPIMIQMWSLLLLEPTTSGTTNSKNAEPTTNKATSNKDTKSNISRTTSSKDVESTAGGATNSTDVEVNMGGLGEANNIIEKETKIYESNIF